MHHGNIRDEIEHYHKDCYGWALYCANRDAELAHEVLQNAYLKMLEKQKTFRRTAEFKTWAFTIIKNTAIDTWRKRRKELRIIKNENEFIDISYEPESENESGNNDKEKFFAEALERLSERQRQILQLLFYHELSLNQSADVLGISQGSVRKHYDRAKKSLADWFQKKGIENL